MATAFRYLKRSKQLALGTHRFAIDEHYFPCRFVAAIAEVGSGSLASLRAALDAARNGGGLGRDDLTVIELIVTTDTSHDTYSEPVAHFALVGSGSLDLTLLVAVSAPTEDFHELIEDLARAFCRTRNVTFESAFTYENDDYLWYEVTISGPSRGATVGDLYDVAIRLHELVELAVAGHFSVRNLPPMRCVQVTLTCSLASTSPINLSARVSPMISSLPPGRSNSPKMCLASRMPNLAGSSRSG